MSDHPDPAAWEASAWTGAADDLLDDGIVNGSNRPGAVGSVPAVPSRTPAIADGSSELPADLGNIASPGPDTIPVYKDGELVPDTAVDGQEIDLAGQRVMLDALAETFTVLAAADIGRAIDEARAQAGLRTDLEPSVYLIHPVKGHAVHITVTQAIADGALGWADATLDDIRRAGLTS